MRKFYFIIFLLQGMLYADSIPKNIFLPLPLNSVTEEPKSNFVLENLQPIPYRIQYHGFMPYKGHVRYIFKMGDDSLVFLDKGERALEGFLIVQSSADERTVIIEDLCDKRFYTLTSGEVTFIPNRFTGVLRNKKEGQCYPISEKLLQINEGQAILVPTNDLNKMYLVELPKSGAPYAYIVPQL